MGDRYSSFAVGEGIPLSSDLGFMASTVIVDNLTASWLDMRGEAGRLVPPFTYGATLPLGAGVQVAQATWATPPNISAAPRGMGTAQLTFTTATLPPSNGVPVVIPSQQVLCQLSAPVVGSIDVTGTSFTLPAGGGNNRVNVTVPAGANSVTVVGVLSGAGGGATLVELIGQTTGTFYLTLTGSNSAFGVIEPPIFVPVEVGADGTYQLRINLPAASSGGTVQVVANFGTQTVAVGSNGTPLPVTGRGGGPIISGDVLGTAFLGISGVNAAQTITLPGPGGGAYVRLSQLVLTWSGATAGAPNVNVTQDSGVGTLWEAIVPSGPTTSPTIFPGGIFTFPVPLVSQTGNGGLIINVSPSSTGGVASVCTGVYTVY